MRTANERRNEILKKLSARRHDTMSNLACEFDVSVRTIQRDIDELSCVAPIFLQQGNGGGVYVQDGWYVNRTYLNDSQEDLLRSLLPGLQPEQRAIMMDILGTFAKPTITKG